MSSNVLAMQSHSVPVEAGNNKTIWKPPTLKRLEALADCTEPSKPVYHSDDALVRLTPIPRHLRHTLTGLTEEQYTRQRVAGWTEEQKIKRWRFLQRMALAYHRRYLMSIVEHDYRRFKAEIAEAEWIRTAYGSDRYDCAVRWSWGQREI
jgi:hypothetical protein